jgi:hypothetical protein
MLTIKIGQTYAHLKGAAIPVVMRSPVFLDLERNGSYLFNFSVILTDELKKELGYAHRPSSGQKVFRKQVTVKYGLLQYSNIARITALNDTEAELYLPVDNGMLAAIQKNLMMRDLDTGGDRRTFQYLSRARNLFPRSIIQQSAQFFSRTEDLPLLAVESDMDGLFQNGGAQWKAARSGNWDLYFNIGVRRRYGQNFRLQIIRNGHLMDELQMGFDDSNMLFFQATGTRQIRHLLPLEVNDIIAFRIFSEASHNPANPVVPWWVEYTIETGTAAGFYINSQLFQATAVGYPMSDYTVFPLYNPGFYADAPRARYLIDEQDLTFLNEKFPLINYFKNNEFPQQLSGEDEGYLSVFNTMVPFPYLAYIVKKIFEKTQTAIEGDNPFEHPELAQICVVSNAAVNAFDFNAFNTIRDLFDLSECVPDESVARFFADHCRALGIVFSYNGQQNSIVLKTLQEIMEDTDSVEFSGNLVSKPSLRASQYDGYLLRFIPEGEDKFVKEFVKPLDEVNYKGEVQNFSNMPLVGNEANDCYFVISEKVYFYWAYDEETGFMFWDVYSIDFQLERKELFEEVDEPRIYTYDLPICPIMMRERPLNDPTFGAHPRDMLLPATNRPGYFKGLPEKKIRNGLLFYRAWRPDGNGAYYPLGTNDIYDLQGEVTTAHPLSLRLDDEPYSLWTRRLKDYILWRARTEGVYTFTKVMTPRELASIDLTRWHRVSGTDYLIREYRFELLSKENLLVQFEAESRYGR